MTIQTGYSGGALGASGPVSYAMVAVTVLVAVSILLEKIGVPSTMLIWGAFVIIMSVMVFAANTMRPSRLAAYAVADRKMSTSMICSGPLIAFSPAGIVAIYWMGGGENTTTTILTLAGMLCGLWVSAVLIGPPLNRSGAYSLPQFLEARFGSPLIRVLSVLLIALPMFVLFCCQLLAFAILLEHLLGVSIERGVIVSTVLVVLLVWLSGLRGALLSGSVSIVVVIITMAFLYWFLASGQVQVSVSQAPELGIMGAVSKTSLPILIEANAVNANWISRAIFTVSTASALSILPAMTQFHSAAATGRKTVSTAFAATLGLIVLSLLTVVAAPAGLLLTLVSPLTAGSGTVLMNLAIIALLSGLLATGAVLLFGFAGLISFDGYQGLLGRTNSENSRLISARMTVLLSAIAACWVVLTWRQAAMSPALVALFASCAAIFPVLVGAIWWRGCGAHSAALGALTGGVFVVCIWLAQTGLFDVSQLLSGPSPVLDFFLTLSLSEAALVGMLVNAAVMVMFSFVPNSSNSTSDAFFDAIHQDRVRRLLNETTL